MKVSPQTFRAVMGTFATGVTVVTTVDGSGAPYGVTVNSFTSVSLNPLLILVCLDNRLTGLGCFMETGRFAVHILGDDQEAVSTFFASRGSDRSRMIDRFSKFGLPVIEGCLARLECRLTDTLPGGDHTILMAEVESAQVAEDLKGRSPLLFFRSRYRRLETEKKAGRP